MAGPPEGAPVDAGGRPTCSRGRPGISGGFTKPSVSPTVISYGFQAVEQVQGGSGSGKGGGLDGGSGGAAAQQPGGAAGECAAAGGRGVLRGVCLQAPGHDPRACI